MKPELIVSVQQRQTNSIVNILVSFLPSCATFEMWNLIRVFELLTLSEDGSHWCDAGNFTGDAWDSV